MPEMTHLPTLSTAAPPPNSAQRSNGAQRSANAQNNGGNKEAGGAKDQDTRAFADVLQGKQAGAQAAETAAQAAGQGKAEAKDSAEDGEEIAVLPQGTDTPPLTIDALIAQRLVATRPEGAVKSDASLGEGAGKGGRDALLGAGDPRAAAGGDARRSLVAGVSKDDAQAVGADPKAQLAASKEGLESGGTDFTALLGRLRQEGSSAVGKSGAAATQAADNPTSTLSMLMPASANPVNDTQNTAATRPTNLIEAPVGSPMFADEAAQRVTWLAKNGIEHAEIRVTPPDMGPIQVSIDMSQNEASINFTVTQTDTRVALEDSLHRLEEMLADSGIALAQANVGQQEAGQQQSGRESAPAGSGSNARGRDGDGRGEVAGVGTAASSPARSAGNVLGLVDTFA
jgi:flagellar hook-length control protein FliK